MSSASNVSKKLLDPDYDPISVYSFAGSIIIPTEQGSYWATAVGGVVEARPTGNPFVLFSLKYLWGPSGEVSEFPEPIRIRLNTAMAVTETFNFNFPAPQVPAEEPVKEQAPLVEDALTGDDEDDEDGEGDEDGGIGDEDDDGMDEEDLADEIDEEDIVDEFERDMAEASHSEDEISW
jgi:hypothetical protein